MNRRDFTAGLGTSALLMRAIATQAQSRAPSGGGRGAAPKEMRADIVVIGASVGGCAAALAALRNGRQVIMTEETDWIGGQFTSMLLSSPDENHWIESVGRTASYAEFRNRVREYYRHNYPLTAQACADTYLSPGGEESNNPMGFRFEPTVSLAVFYEMFAPYISSGKLILLTNHKPVSVDASADAVETVSARDPITDMVTILHAPLFLDATDKGEVIYLSKTEYVTGFESQEETGELHAPPEAQPHNFLGTSMGFAADYIRGEDHTIEKPEDYRFWRDFVPKLTPPWTGKLLSLTAPNSVTLEPETPYFDPEEPPEKKNTGPGPYNLWYGRVMLNKDNFVPGAYQSSIVIVHGGRWRQMDYFLGNLYEVSDEEAARHLKQAKQQSLSFLYWLQTECPRPDGGTGWKGLRLRRDCAGTEDGLQQYPYLREGRRIKARFTVSERHIGTAQRMKETGLDQEHVTAEQFKDSVGIGAYRIDLHPSTGGNNYIDKSSLPYQIPLGAMIPQRMRNLLPACKNIGTTHLANGALHQHVPEWSIGETAGMLASYCLEKKLQPAQVLDNEQSLLDFQRRLVSQGLPIRWPRFGPLYWSNAGTPPKES
jgi:hypothetical protein